MSSTPAYITPAREPPMSAPHCHMIPLQKSPAVPPRLTSPTHDPGDGDSLVCYLRGNAAPVAEFPEKQRIQTHGQRFNANNWNFPSSFPTSKKSIPVVAQRPVPPTVMTVFGRRCCFFGSAKDERRRTDSSGSTLNRPWSRLCGGKCYR
jgi:hypothetical protein